MADCCENCGWSEIVGSPIMCNFTGHRTFRDEICQAWKPKEEKTNMVEIVRCKDCKHYDSGLCWNVPKNESPRPKEETFFCADGRRKDGEQE